AVRLGVMAATAPFAFAIAALRALVFRLASASRASGHGNNGLAIRRIADARAEAVSPTIRELRKAGFVSSLAIARELNEREIPTARGCKWHRTSVDQLENACPKKI